MNLVESKSSTQHGYLYGFDKLPRVAQMTIENPGKSAEATSDANNKDSVSQAAATFNTNLSKVDTTNASAKINNPGQSTTITKQIGTDAKAEIKAKGNTKTEEGALPSKPTPDDPQKGKFIEEYKGFKLYVKTEGNNKIISSWKNGVMVTNNGTNKNNKKPLTEAQLIQYEKEYIDKNLTRLSNK